MDASDEMDVAADVAAGPAVASRPAARGASVWASRSWTRRSVDLLGVGAQQFLVIKQLQVLGETSQAELADAPAIDPSNLAAIAADLSDRDLVVRSRHEGDRRRYVLRLGRAGEHC
jgi:DNA-binding MarR family transcriptional regulator